MIEKTSVSVCDAPAWASHKDHQLAADASVSIVATLKSYTLHDVCKLSLPPPFALTLITVFAKARFNIIRRVD